MVAPPRSVRDGDDRLGPIITLITSLAQGDLQVLFGDPAAAAQWIEALSPGPLQVALFQQLIHAWAQKDPAAAGDWLGSIAEHLTGFAGWPVVDWQPDTPIAEPAASASALNWMGTPSASAAAPVKS